MPVLSYDLDKSEYNWGYNPLCFNSVHKEYVLDIDDPYAYVNEFRKTVNVLHENGIKVTLDLVFNHVYDREQFDLNKMLPGHVFRYKHNHRYAEGTYCGNELKSEDVFMREYFKKMIRRYIELFDIDGIRFDLMGIMDIETIEEIYLEAKKLKNDFIIYGEGWNMGDVLPVEKRACIDNADKLEDIKMFNDFFRDTIINYVCGNKQINDKVMCTLKGEGYHLQTRQSINYVECHDNYTFFDRLMVYKNQDPLWVNIRRSRLAMALVMVSRGLPFIHMGEEFLRTKKLYENSYNAGDEINGIDWYRRVEYNSSCDFLKDLIEIRNSYPQFEKEDVKIDVFEHKDCLIYDLDDLRIYINPNDNDCLYEDDSENHIIFSNEGKCDFYVRTIAIPAYSLVIGKR